MTLRAVLEPPTPGAGKRSRARQALRLTARYGRGDRQAGAVLVHDLSAEGMLVESPEALAIGARLTVELPRSGVHEAVVVWSSGAFHGCRFVKPLPPAAVSAALLKALPADGTTAPPSPSPAASLPERLAALRRGRDWSMEEFASRLGVSRQCVWYWECGRRQPKPAMLRRIATLFGLSEGELLRADPFAHWEDIHGWKSQIADHLGIAADRVKILIEL